MQLIPFCVYRVLTCFWVFYQLKMTVFIEMQTLDYLLKDIEFLEMHVSHVFWLCVSARVVQLRIGLFVACEKNIYYINGWANEKDCFSGICFLFWCMFHVLLGMGIYIGVVFSSLCACGQGARGLGGSGEGRGRGDSVLAATLSCRYTV